MPLEYVIKPRLIDWKEYISYSEKRTLSVSIVTYKTDPDLLNRCLSNLINAIERCQDSLELSMIWIIENDYNRTEIQEQYLNHKRIKILASKKNLGFGRAHNTALFREESCYHLFLNPDAFLSEDFFVKAQEVFFENKETALVGPKGVNEKREDLFLAKAYPRLCILLARGLNNRFLNKVLKRGLEKYTYRNKKNYLFFPVQHLSGCCLLGRTEALKRIKGFDEKFFLYFEDFDLCRRIAQHGKVIYFTSTSIFHGGGNVGRKNIWHKLLFLSSAFKFYQRYGWRM